jgi:hypothetical protein
MGVRGYAQICLDVTRTDVESYLTSYRSNLERIPPMGDDKDDDYQPLPAPPKDPPKPEPGSPGDTDGPCPK